MAVTDRVGIEVDVLGYEEAIAQMKALEQSVKGLKGRKNYIELQAKVKGLKEDLLGKKAHKIKIQAEMKDVDNKLRRANRMLKKLNKQKIQLKADGKSTADVERRIARLTGYIDRLQGRKITLQSNLASISGQISAATAQLQRFESVLRRMQSMSFGQIFKGTASTFAHIGQAMQSAGNSLTRMASPVRRMVGLLGIGAGMSGFAKISEGLSSGFKRYDVMKKYPKMMAQMGYSSEAAQKSINDLNKAVDGLPTGLDEIVEVAQRYTLSLGDIEKGTNLAIAANNAFLASMSTEDQRYQGMLQLQDLINGKKLRNTEWASLISSMGVAINEVGKELGYADDEMAKFRQDLMGNKVETKDFLNALEKVATGEGKVAQMAKESMDTWEAFTSRIGTAFSRMTYGMLTSLDEIVNAFTGGKIKSLNMFFDDLFIPKIDAMTEAAKNWIKANPDKITDFFNALKSINWKSLGQGFLEGVGAIVKMIQGLAKVLDGKSLKNIGRIMAFLAPLGTTFTIVGGLLKGFRHVGGFAVASLATLARGLVGFGAALGAGKMLNLGTKLTKFIDALKNFGKLKAATDTAETAAKVAAKKSIGLKAFGKTIVKSLGGLVAVMAVPVIIGGGIMLTVKAVKNIVKDLGTITADMDKIDTGNLKKLVNVGSTIGILVSTIGATIGGLATAAGGAGWVAVGGAVAGIAVLSGVITGLAGMAKLFTGGVKGAIKNLADATQYMSDISDNLETLKDKEFDMDGLKDAVKALAEMKGVLKQKGMPTESEASAFKTLYGNLKDAITSIRQAADELKALEGIKFDIDKAVGKAEDIGEGLTKVYNAIKTGIEEGGGHVDRFEEGKSKRAKGIIGNIQSMLGSITQTFDDLNKILDSNLQFTKSGRGPQYGIVDKARQISEGLWNTYNAIYKAIAPDQTTTYQKGANKATTGQTQTSTTRGQITGAMKSEAENLDLFISQLSSVFSKIREAYNSLTGDNSLADLDTKAFGDSATIAGDLINSVAGIWTKIQPNLGNFANVNPDDMSTQFEGLLGMIKGVRPIITEIASLTQELGGMGGEEGGLPGLGFGNLGEQAQGRLDLSGILGTLPGLVKQLSTVSTQIAETDFTTALPNLDMAQEMLNKVSALGNTIQSVGLQIAELDMSGVSMIGAKLQSMVSQINAALNMGVVNQIQASVNAFRATLLSIFDALNADFANVKVTVNIRGTVNGASRLIALVRQAQRAISKAVNSIRTNYTKRVSVNIVGSVHRSGNFGGMGNEVNTGGMITPMGAMYYSKGGSVPYGTFPGHPKGTDTVPSWLTPGEWVTKRRATGFWGVDFMRMINRMDVEGVLRAASSKANSVMNTARNTTIYNNITNNYNNTNNQNIKTNNPNFAGLRSRRALGMI